MPGKCMVQIVSVNELSRAQPKSFWVRLWSPLKVPCIEQMHYICSLMVFAVVSEIRKVVTFQWISTAHSRWQSTQSTVEDPCTNIIEKSGIVSGIWRCAFSFFGWKAECPSTKIINMFEWMLWDELKAYMNVQLHIQYEQCLLSVPVIKR